MRIAPSSLSGHHPRTKGREISMDEVELRGLIAAVKAGRVSRRAFVCRMIGLGLTAPFANQLLTHAGMAQTSTRAEYKPTKAGGGGALKMLFWQAPTLLNPHFAVGTKDQEGSRIFYEPLASWDQDGNLAPVLAAGIPEIDRAENIATARALLHIARLLTHKGSQISRRTPYVCYLARA